MHVLVNAVDLMLNVKNSYIKRKIFTEKQVNYFSKGSFYSFK